MKPPKKSWVFDEAEKLARHVDKKKKTDPVIFQTGYGPSGLPHIGTFAEVNRTTFVRHAFETLTGKPSKLIAFSDDMDGLRKVPTDLPQKDMLTENLGRPLCKIPDPFGEQESFSGYMNQKLKEFLNHHNLEHDYRASHTQYEGGVFNDVILRVLEKVEQVKGVILPTLQPENRKAWSPFMPICENCGKNLSTLVTEYDAPKGEIAYHCHGEAYAGVHGCDHKGKVSVTDGKVKVGWKVDWAVRWTAFDVDFEMYGKDLIESYNLSKKICRIIGGTPPHDYFYEMFLDNEGKKISKSKGNQAVGIDEWVKYAPLESLTYYLFPNPRRAKKLYFDVIPKCVDEFLNYLREYPGLPTDEHRHESPIWHILYPNPERINWNATITFSLINNLVSALGSDDQTMILDYIDRYDDKAKSYPAVLKPMVERSLRYYKDHILPTKKFHKPSDEEKSLIKILHQKIAALPPDVEGDQIQKEIFNTAKENQVEPKVFFKLLYRTLLGQESGPRLGAFFKLLGLEETSKRLQAVL